ncbi:hypothetical protein [Veronia pacifica]|uniref:hypothetical protein n=1 Tax=Veronia pacifica TaxID=1080227 RepID=UPI001585E4CB|nr:hypothetical protein [Veronia pacifica]
MRIWTESSWQLHSPGQNIQDVVLDFRALPPEEAQAYRYQRCHRHRKVLETHLALRISWGAVSTLC